MIKFYLLLLTSTFIIFCDQDKVKTPDVDTTHVDTVVVKNEIPEKYKPLWNPGYSDKKLIFSICNYKKITLERFGCYGTCPVYKIKLNIDGTVKYTGIKYVDKIGKYSGELFLLRYGKLCYMIDEYLEKYNEINYEAPWTDDETCIISLLMKNGTIIKITDYGRQGPIELWAIQKTIDGLVSNLELTKIEK